MRRIVLPTRRGLTGLAVAILFASLPLLCFREVLGGALLLPTDWLYQGVEPWRGRAPVDKVVNARIKDAVLDGYALDLVSARAARNGEIRLWNPWVGGGIPHLAAGFSRMLYPPFWVYAVMPPDMARNFEILLHLALAQGLAWLWLRRVGAGTHAATVGGVVFAFTPSITHRAEISFILPTLVWLPALLLGVESVARQGRPRDGAVLSAAVALQVLPGHYPDIMLHLLGAALYGAVRIVTVRPWKVAIERIALACAAVALGFSLAAPFLLPSFALLADVNRPVNSAAELSATGLSPRDLFLTLLTPRLSRSQLYVGLLPLLILPLAWSRQRRPLALALLPLVVVGVGFATGSPLFTAAHGLLPFLRRLRYLETLVSLASFALALMAGLASIALFDASPGSSLLRRLAWTSWVAAGAAATVWGCGWAPADAPIAAASLALGALGLMLRAAGRIDRNVLALCLVAAVALDLMAFAREFNPRIDRQRLPPFPEFSTIRFLRQDPDEFRVLTLRGMNDQRAFWPNTLAAYGIEDAGAYHSLLPRLLGRYFERIRRVVEGAKGPALLEERDPAENLLLLADYGQTALIRAWNVRYLIVPAGTGNPDPGSLDLVHEGDTRVYRLRDALPRAWRAAAAVVAPEPGVYQILSGPAFDPRRTVLLEQEPACSTLPPPGPAKSAWGAEEGARVVLRDPEHIVIETQGPGPAYLVVSEFHDPDWQTTVDGRVVSSLRANLAFRAVPVSSGFHRVEMRYRPPLVRWGIIVAGAAGALLLAWSLAPGIPAPRRRVVGVALAAVPVAIAAFGWQRSHAARVQAPPCGELVVRERLLDRRTSDRAVFGNRVMPARVGALPDVLDWRVKAAPRAILRLSALASVDTRLEIGVGTSSGTESTPATIALEAGVTEDVELSLPDGTERISLRAAARAPGRVTWGNPVLFAPSREAPPSVVCADGRRASTDERRWWRALVIDGTEEPLADEVTRVAAPRFVTKIGDDLVGLHRFATWWTLGAGSSTLRDEAENVVNRRSRRLGLEAGQTVWGCLE